MLVFNKEDINSIIVVTLTELTTIQTTPLYYLFIFTHIETKAQIKKVLANADDSSLYKYRYNKWTVITNDFIGTSPDGSYVYDIYEQTSSSDTTTTGKNLVETGKAIVNGLQGFEFDKYNTATTYKSYNG